LLVLLLHQRGLRSHLKVHYQGQTPIELENNAVLLPDSTFPKSGTHFNRTCAIESSTSPRPFI